MQNVIIRYVDDLKARMELTRCSIAQALGVVLPRYNRATLLKLRAGAYDLVRILELEIQLQDELAEVKEAVYTEDETGSHVYWCPCPRCQKAEGVTR